MPYLAEARMVNIGDPDDLHDTIIVALPTKIRNLFTHLRVRATPVPEDCARRRPCVLRKDCYLYCVKNQ